MLFSVRQWRGAASKGEGEVPGWMRKLDGITAARAVRLAALFNSAKPKNLLLTIGAGLAVAQVGASAAGQATAIGVFVMLGTIGLGVPLSIHLLTPNRGTDRLVALRDRMVGENATIVAVLCIVIAAELLGDAVTSLAS